MPSRADLADLDTFLNIVRHGGFRRAATVRGVSASALSHAIRGLEARLGVRLLHRTSRSVKLTAAGEILFQDLDPEFRRIDEALSRLDRFREGPVGRIRINVLRDAAILLLRPLLPAFAATYPEIEIEVAVEDRFVDVIAGGFDAGIRYGGSVPDGMVAARLSGELEWVVVGSPAYLDAAGRPQKPEDLYQHRCIRVRTGDGRLYRWELGAGDDAVTIDVTGTITLDDSELSIRAAEAGAGLYYCLKARVAQEVAEGRLEVVLPEWRSSGPGFYAYYAGRRQIPNGLRSFLDFVRAHSAL
jgi:DNA-binding transcriptional LysR family regulator